MVSHKKVEIFKSMEDWAKNSVLTLLKPIEECWQLKDFLPDPTSDKFIEQELTFFIIRMKDGSINHLNC